MNIEDLLPGRGVGIDLIEDEGTQPPIMPYLATLLLTQAGVPLDENPCVEEFRATIVGLYIRVDGEEYLVGARRLDQGTDKAAGIISMHDPQDIMAAAHRLNPYLTEPTCGMCLNRYSECTCHPSGGGGQ